MAGAVARVVDLAELILAPVVDLLPLSFAGIEILGVVEEVGRRMKVALLQGLLLGEGCREVEVHSLWAASLRLVL